MPRTKYVFILLFLFPLIIFITAACQTEDATEIAADTATPTETAAVATATDTPAPTNTPEPTATPTDTPAPTDTPTATPEPTETEPAVKPTNTPATKPTATATVSPDNSQEPDPTAEPDDEGETTEPTDDASDQDLLTLIAESETALQSLRTVSMNQVVNVSVSGIFTQTLRQSCQVQQNDGEQAYCLTTTTVIAEEETFESQNEVVQLDDTMWIRMDEEVEWTELSPDELDESGFSSENIAELRLSDFITETVAAEDTTIDGVPVHEIDFVLDVDAYFGFVMGEETAGMFTAVAQEGQGAGKIWIGQEDLLPRKIFVEMSFIIEGEQMILTVQGAYTDFNEPVTIPDPTATN